MTEKEIMRHVDHTQLKAFATWEDIKKLCDEAVEYQTASVCIPPCYIQRVKEAYGEQINICTVVGFSTRLQCDRGEDRRDKEGAGGRCV